MSGSAFDRAEVSGVRVIGERRSGEALALAVVLEVGTSDEGLGEGGAAHLLEHLAFRGDAQTSGDALAARIDALGGNVNAFTSHEQTCYHGVVERERAEALTGVLATLLAPSLRDADVAAERAVVAEEIAMADDDPVGRVFEWGAARYYRDHPHGRPVLGEAASVAALGAVDLARFRARTHHRERATVVAVGAYDFPHLLSALAPIVAALPAGPPPAARAERRGAFAVGEASLVVPGLQRAHRGVYAPAPKARSRSRIAAELLMLVLGAPDHGRLHWALIEPGLADVATAWVDTALDHGVFGIHAAVAPRAHARAGAVIADVLSAFERGGPTEREWAAAQRSLALAATLEQETVEGRALALAVERGPLRSAAREVEAILATPREAGLALLARRPFSRAFHFEWRPGRVVASAARWRP